MLVELGAKGNGQDNGDSGSRMEATGKEEMPTDASIEMILQCSWVGHVMLQQPCKECASAHIGFIDVHADHGRQ